MVLICKGTKNISIHAYNKEKKISIMLIVYLFGLHD